jgi:hypothetical protein
MIVFRLFLVIDAAAALVALYFFFIGLGDGSVSSFNIAIWLALLGGIAAILVGGWMLSAKGQRRAAIGVLAILAVPAFLCGLLIVLMIVLQPRWN